MPDDVNAVEVADALLASVGLLVRRVRQLPADDALSMPERSVLSRLDREGPASSAELARAAQISPQSMGATVAALTKRGFVRRAPDQNDGRRVVLSVTRAGLALLRTKRNTRSQQLASALDAEFSAVELGCLLVAAPLIERLAHRV